jgi:hypothetical protein
MHFSSLQYLNFINKNWQVKLKFGQVSFFVICPNGQVAKKVNVEPCYLVHVVDKHFIKLIWLEWAMWPLGLLLCSTSLKDVVALNGFCLVCLFLAAQAIFQLSGGCYHYRWRGCKFRQGLCLSLSAISEGSYMCHTYSDMGPPFFKFISKRPMILTSECRALCDGAITTYFKRLRFDAAGMSGAQTHYLPDAMREHYHSVAASSFPVALGQKKNTCVYCHLLEKIGSVGQVHLFIFSLFYNLVSLAFLN